MRLRRIAGAILRPFTRRPLGITIDDLVHEGLLAFLEAASRAQFAQLAYERARWAMRDAVSGALRCGLTGRATAVRASGGRVRAIGVDDACDTDVDDCPEPTAESYAIARAVLDRHLSARSAELCRWLWLDDESIDVVAERQRRTPQQVRVARAHARSILRRRLAFTTSRVAA